MSIKTKLLRALLFCLATSAAAAQIAPLSVVTLSGQQAPGLPIGVTFSAIDFAFGFGYLNNHGQVSFLAFVEGPGITPNNDRGIWVGLPGALSLLAHEGSPLPAGGAGVINPTPPALNGANRIAFRATLAGDGITFANDDVIIAANALGDLVIAAGEGQVVEIAPGEFRTFTSFGNLTGPGTQDGSSTSWNDDCRLLFRAEF